MEASWFVQLATQALVLPPWPGDRFPPSPYYRFLRLLAQNVQPSLSVELGLCGGGGSFHLCEGWSQGTVVGVESAEPNRDQKDNWRFIQARHPSFMPWRGDSVESADRIADTYGKVDVLFIDTVHEYEQTMREWEAWLPHLSQRCVVCLDDLLKSCMAEFWDWVPWPKVRLDDLHTGPEPECGGGFGVTWKDG